MFFGWRTITTREFRRAVRAPCPSCRVADARLVGLARRRWFTLMFIPIVPVEQWVRRANGVRRNTFANTIVAYNDLRDHPADGQRLLQLMRMYEELGEPGEAESATRHFPAALAAEPACAAVLDGIRRTAAEV